MRTSSNNEAFMQKCEKGNTGQLMSENLRSLSTSLKSQATSLKGQSEVNKHGRQLTAFLNF